MPFQFHTDWIDMTFLCPRSTSSFLIPYSSFLIVFLIWLLFSGFIITDLTAVLALIFAGNVRAVPAAHPAASTTGPRRATAHRALHFCASVSNLPVFLQRRIFPHPQSPATRPSRYTSYAMCCDYISPPPHQDPEYAGKFWRLLAETLQWKQSKQKL